MAIPFTVDIKWQFHSLLILSAFYGEPDFREQDSGTIVDRRKTLNLYTQGTQSTSKQHVKERAKQSPPPLRKKRGATKRTLAKKSAGAICFQ